MKRILIVDDEPDFCEAVKKNLEAAGEFEVSACSDSKAAVQLAGEVRPDVILLDVMMPGLSGPEIAEQLKRDAMTRTIPIVFLTAVVTDEETAQKKNVIGGEYFVAKPVMTEDLIRVIDSASSSIKR